MENRQNTPTETSRANLERVTELVAENRTVFEQLASSNLPIAEDAERALEFLQDIGEDE